MDPDIDALLRRGEIEQAASLARERGLSRRAAELFALAGRHADGVIVALQSGEWRHALELALSSNDDRIVTAVCEEVGKYKDFASPAAAQARIARRIDIAARLLEDTLPSDAALAWYEVGDYARAGRCHDRANEPTLATRAYEQHLAQSPDDAEIAVRLAELRAEHGDDEGAVRALQTAVRADPDVRAMKLLVDALARVGLDGSARAVIRRLRARDPSAPAEVSEYAGSLPRSVSAEKRYAGRYRVIREVGSGASGRVLEAWDELKGEAVALKVLSVGDDRSGAFGRFMREAELARVLDDPTIVRMRALDPEGPTIVYDWMPGGTLADRIGALRLGEVRLIATRIITALETLHRNGVVHRDLKPSNVLFDPAGQARVSDLGAAHLGDLGSTVTGGLVGSLPYMSPEQITGADVSAATDLYAFGCVLFQMLTGSLPYSGPDFMTQHLSDPIPRISDLRPALGTVYDSALASLLAKNPDDRPPDAASARKLLSTLPFTEPEDDHRAPVAPRRSSIPAPAGNDATRLSPTAIEGRWLDSRLGREIDIVRIPMSSKDLLAKWAGASSSALQAVYEVLEDGDELVAWVEPATDDTLLASELEPSEKSQIDGALQEIDIEPRRRANAQVSRSFGHGVVALLRSVLGESSHPLSIQDAPQ